MVVVAVGAVAAVLLLRPAEHGGTGDDRGSARVSLDPVPHPRVEIPFVRGSSQAEPDTTTAIWRLVDEASTVVQPPYPSEWSEAGRALVDVSTAAAAASGWRVGDRVSMQLPQGPAFEGSIDRIDEGPGYSRAALGFAASADGTPRRFVVTVGPTRVFAYLDTAEGPYELVADTRSGWLLPSSSMLAGFDYSRPDYIVPQRPADVDEPEPDGP
ncbi:MAG: hypothetical protein OXG44_22010 [Gammaproteobacteria bacterium]|nr:hypothetical protein [Gammaproteobacteria bacterium]MDE0193213.1 hypothetical protein [Gammaproteobacteria bacterium]